MHFVDWRRMPHHKLLAQGSAGFAPSRTRGTQPWDAHMQDVTPERPQCTCTDVPSDIPCISGSYPAWPTCPGGGGRGGGGGGGGLGGSHSPEASGSRLCRMCSKRDTRDAAVGRMEGSACQASSSKLLSCCGMFGSSGGRKPSADTAAASSCLRPHTIPIVMEEYTGKDRLSWPWACCSVCVFEEGGGGGGGGSN